MLETEQVAWLTPHAASRAKMIFASSYLQIHRFSFYFVNLIFNVARSSHALSEIVDVVSIIGAVSGCLYIKFKMLLLLWPFRAHLQNAASLAYLMEQCQSLKHFSIMCML
jgi:hypothetical protein